MQARCRNALVLFFLPLTLFTYGCRSNTGKIENELRSKTELYREALEEQRRIEAQNLHLRQELDASRNAAKKSPDQVLSPSGVKRITLGRETRGVDQDDKPGDEWFQVVLEPRDSEEQIFKAPGTMQIWVLEITPQGTKTPLSTWEIGPDKVEGGWKTGLLSTGYTIVQPWKILPIYENVRFVVRFTTLDGRTFEADRDIKVKVVPGAIKKRPETLLSPEGSPVPCPTPIFEGGPIILPTSSTSWKRTPGDAPTTHRTQWRPVTPPIPAVSLGEPRRLEE
jgi:hypothetical protein